MMTVFHVQCGKPAFYYEGDGLRLDQWMTSSDAHHLDGRPVMPMELALCDSCGQAFRFHTSELRPEEGICNL